MKTNTPFTITKKRKEYLEQMGLSSYFSILNYLPYRYDNFADSAVDISQHNKTIAILALVVAKSKISRFKKNFSRFAITLSKDGEEIKTTVFNRAFYYNQVVIGQQMIVRGKYDYYKKEMMATDLLFSLENINTIKPIYSLPHGVRDTDFAKIVNATFNYLADCEALVDIIPLDLIQQYRLISRQDAYFQAHFPQNMEEVRQALRYLKYEELLIFSLGMQLLRKQHQENGLKTSKKINFAKIKEIIHQLPYQLTNDQKYALKDILEDLNGENIMYRLLQGDVGTGKTLVAALSMIAVALSDYQAVMMVPTDILARQHYKYLKDLYPHLEVVLLVSNLSKKDKDEALNKIKDGRGLLIVGTQALIQEKVNYHNLGYIIIDEQHRFGVNQRRLLKEKGTAVDFLAMSATPIPRTLAISLYGDMDVSILSQFPAKTRNVKTTVIVGKTIKALLKEIMQTIHLKKRVYIICPMIEGDNDTKRNVNDVYDGLTLALGKMINIGMLHGRMSDDDKIAEMNKFKNGESDILVSTTVVEVGVDVKDATMMIIYDAESFGLAQIHQLRGRIGRSGDESFCYLLTSKNDEETLQRLTFLEKCNDGFEIARFDLSIRGPGELAGYKQSGLPTLMFASFIDDLKVLDIAQKDAANIIKNIDDQKNKKIIDKTLDDFNKKIATFD